MELRSENNPISEHGDKIFILKFLWPLIILVIFVRIFFLQLLKAEKANFLLVQKILQRIRFFLCFEELQLSSMNFSIFEKDPSMAHELFQKII